MSAISSKGISVYITSKAPTVLNLVPTAISKASPAEVTVASATGVNIGDLVKMEGTGFNEIEGKTYVVGAVDTGTNKFSLLGSDTTGSTGTLGSSPKATLTQVADMVKLCLSNITINPETPGTIPAGTYCDPSASLPAVSTSAGTITLDGFIDKSDNGYKELLMAAEEAQERWIEVLLPQSQGYVIFPVTLSSISFGLPLDGGLTFSATGALGSKPRHLF